MKLKDALESLVRNVKFWLTLSCCAIALGLGVPWAVPLVVLNAALWAGYDYGKAFKIG